MHAVLYCQFYEILNYTTFLKNLGNKGKLQVSSCRCLLHQNDPQDKYLEDMFYQTVPIPQWHALDQTLLLAKRFWPKHRPTVGQVTNSQ